MPSSLRFVVALLAAGVVAAATSLTTLFVGDRERTRTTAEALTGGRVASGKAAIGRYGCGACHVIRGIDGADGRVGPSLDGIAVRAEIAGVLANSPDAMIRWLRAPQQVVPGNGMPDQGIGDREARDIAAYLYTLKSS